MESLDILAKADLIALCSLLFDGCFRPESNEKES